MSATIQLNGKLISTLSTVLFVPSAELMNAAGITSTTWYHIMQQPDSITIQQLLAIANAMHIPARRFFYTGSTAVIGRRDEYVTDPYTECYYDTDALQAYVLANNNASWKQAAKEIGVTRDNLRNSLLGTRRTPVLRFLQVCHIFGVDPFTFLIDPNPISSKSSRRQSATSGPASPDTEIDKLRSDIRNLSDTVTKLNQKYDDLNRQYDHLQKSHEALLREFRAYTGDSYTHRHVANENQQDSNGD